MASRNLPREEVLKDSEATLREMAGILSDLGADAESVLPEQEADGPDPVAAMLRDLPQLEKMAGLFFRTYREIISVIESLRDGRGILHRAALERVQRTHEKIEEVSSATEVAAADMLDGLDRALTLVDQIGKGEEDSEVQGELQEQLHGLISILQFQDITAQQLSYAAGVLKDTEDRLTSLVELFEIHGIIGNDPEPAEEEEDTSEGPTTFDPAASTKGADDRQALVDEIFSSPSD